MASTKTIPTPADIRAAREAAGLTQTQAAALIYSGLRAWQEWEAGNRKMHPQLFEAFCQKSRGAR
jgi:putative transcriptional regulator